MKTFDPKQFESILGLVLNQKKAEHVVVKARGMRQGASRFAGSQIVQNVALSDLTVEIEASFGSQVGTAKTNQLDRQSIGACLARAEEIARLSPPDPEFLPPVAPVPLPTLSTHVEATARCSPADRAEAIARALEATASANLVGSGLLSTTENAFAIGNSAGLVAFQRETEASLSFSASRDECAGRACGFSRDVRTLDGAGVARQAVSRALAAKNPREIPPGRYDVILEPDAVRELIGSFGWMQLNARETAEGRTALVGKQGSRVAGPEVELLSDPQWPGCQVRPFDEEGSLRKPTHWVRGGVLENLQSSRFWSKKTGAPFVGTPGNLIMKGKDTSLEAMIKSTRRGLLITRFWYLNPVDRMRDLYTGTTRDGTLWIENGEVVSGVKNLRFNDSALRVLSSIESLGRVQTDSSWEGYLVCVPYLKVKDFQFTSVTGF